MGDPTAAERFYTTAFGLGPQLHLRASQAPTAGFRAFTLSLTVPQPGNVNALIGAALDASPVKFGLYGRRALAKDAGVAPDGTGSHRIAIDSDAGAFTDPDGFAWEAAQR